MKNKTLKEMHSILLYRGANPYMRTLAQELQNLENKVDVKEVPNLSTNEQYENVINDYFSPEKISLIKKGKTIIVTDHTLYPDVWRSIKEKTGGKLENMRDVIINAYDSLPKKNRHFLSW